MSYYIETRFKKEKIEKCLKKFNVVFMSNTDGLYDDCKIMNSAGKSIKFNIRIYKHCIEFEFENGTIKDIYSMIGLYKKLKNISK